MTGRFVLAAALLAAGALSAHAQTVKVEFLMGKVNLVAQNAPLRAILAEWSRVGGTRLINSERLLGGPVTLELVGVPERQALEILLREIGGYMLGPRQALVPGVSAFDRLVVVASTPGRPGAPAPVFQPPRPTPQIGRAFAPPIVQEPDEDDVDFDELEEDEDEADDEPDDRTRRPALAPNLPALPGVPPGAGGPNRPSPGNPFGVTPGSTRPGTIAPAPEQPAQPGSETSQPNP